MGGGFDVLQRPFQHTYFGISLTLKYVAQLMADNQSPTRTDGIHKQRMRPVERVNKAPRFDARPAARLHGSRYFQGQFIEVFLPFVKGDFTFIHQTQEIAVGADVVETVVVYADVADVGGHFSEGLLFGPFQNGLVACGFKLQNGRAKLKTLGPFCPASGGVLPGNGKNGRAF